MKEKIKSFFEETSPQQLAYQRLFLLMQIAIFVLAILAKRSMFFPCLLVCLFAFIYMYFTAEFSEGERLWKQWTAFVLTLLFGIFGTIFGFVMDKIPSSALVISAAIGIMITILFLIELLPSKNQKEKRESIENMLTSSKYTDADGLAPGDTMLGYDAATGKPNVIPYKDRFLHFLVLGATGSGKTSQSLTPMAARDVKNKELGVVVLEPKGDFAEKVYALAKIAGRDDVIYFNPTLKDCPYFNPLRGEMNDVIESLTTAFSSMDGDSKQYFKDMNKALMSNAITVVKTLKGDDATLVDLNTLITNKQEALKMLRSFNEAPCTDLNEKSRRAEIFNYFMNDYLTGIGGAKTGSKTYENSSGVRTQLANLISNSYLRKVLNPPAQSTLGKNDFIDFERVLEEGSILCMCSAQGALRDLGKTLGMFLIQSFEAAVFRRPGDEDTRRGVIFYVDEFQKYANKGYDDMLTQGRSYRVSSVLATQSRAAMSINSGALGKVLTETVSGNARNKIIYPGCPFEDAQFYSKEFGEIEQETEKISISRGRTFWSKYDIGDQRESVSKEKKTKPLFTPTDIMNRPFGEAVARTMYHDSVQPAKVVKLSFIDKDLNKQVKEYIDKYIRPRTTEAYSKAMDYDPTEKDNMPENKVITPPEQLDDFDDEILNNIYSPTDNVSQGDFADDFKDEDLY